MNVAGFSDSDITNYTLATTLRKYDIPHVDNIKKLSHIGGDYKEINHVFEKAREIDPALDRLITTQLEMQDAAFKDRKK